MKEKIKNIDGFAITYYRRNSGYWAMTVLSYLANACHLSADLDDIQRHTEYDIAKQKPVNGKIPSDYFKLTRAGNILSLHYHGNADPVLMATVQYEQQLSLNNTIKSDK